MRGLRAAAVPGRALVRPGSGGATLRALGADVVEGDFRDPGSLQRAVEGVAMVVSTVTAMARALAGERDADFTGLTSSDTAT